MKTHFNLSDREFERQFAQCTLDPAIFNHEAHLRLAWIHLKKSDVETAIDTVCRQLAAYTQALGARDKFNKTLTVAAVRAVYHFMLKSNPATFQDFITVFPRLKSNFKELLGYHYGVDIYHSEQAKREYLEPDLLPFD